MTGSSPSTSFAASTSASSTSGPSSGAPRRSRTFLKFTMTSFGRSTWTPLGRSLLLRRSTPALRLRLLSCSLPPSAPFRPPNNNNNRNKGNGVGNGGKNISSGGGCGGNSGNTTAVSTGSTSNDGSATSPWSTYVNPWQGHIAMYPDLVPTGQQRTQALLIVPGHYTPPGFMSEQQNQPLYQ
jgi:hypothetical protein